MTNQSPKAEPWTRDEFLNAVYPASEYGAEDWRTLATIEALAAAQEELAQYAAATKMEEAVAEDFKTALTSEREKREAAERKLRQFGCHEANYAAYKVIGRFGSRSGLRWVEGDEKRCNCGLGAK
jgi:hypothetical protein